MLLSGLSAHAQRWCPTQDGEQCEEDNLYYEHMCCGDLELSNECCKAFTMFDYLIGSLGFAFVFVITYAVCSSK
ncbi:hypothetical protein Y032_0045g1112 [Ancylostoma ceylanicum]|nr:hypothetical protein Y032_0045g1112 [Ancylostoma ceylanicum]